MMMMSPPFSAMNSMSSFVPATKSMSLRFSSIRALVTPICQEIGLLLIGIISTNFIIYLVQVHECFPDHGVPSLLPSNLVNFFWDSSVWEQDVDGEEFAIVPVLTKTY